jgi:hypothetical protein
MNAMINSSSSRHIVWRNWAAVALGLFGLTAMVGDVVGSRTLKGLGMISMTAPCPKVFCAMEGYEGFAGEFVIHYTDASGEPQSVALTPEQYARLAGPYNRRNVYGAALAGAPILPEPMWRSVFQYGFQPTGPLRRELGVPPDATAIAVVIHTKTHNRNDSWQLHLE